MAQAKAKRQTPEFRSWMSDIAFAHDDGYRFNRLRNERPLLHHNPTFKVFDTDVLWQVVADHLSRFPCRAEKTFEVVAIFGSRFVKDPGPVLKLSHGTFLTTYYCVIVRFYA